MAKRFHPAQQMEQRDFVGKGMGKGKHVPAKIVLTGDYDMPMPPFKAPYISPTTAVVYPDGTVSMWCALFADEKCDLIVDLEHGDAVLDGGIVTVF